MVPRAGALPAVAAAAAPPRRQLRPIKHPYRARRRPRPSSTIAADGRPRGHRRRRGPRAAFVTSSARGAAGARATTNARRARAASIECPACIIAAGRRINGRAASTTALGAAAGDLAPPRRPLHERGGGGLDPDDETLDDICAPRQSRRRRRTCEPPICASRL